MITSLFVELIIGVIIVRHAMITSLFVELIIGVIIVPLVVAFGALMGVGEAPGLVEVVLRELLLDDLFDGVHSLLGRVLVAGRNREHLVLEEASRMVGAAVHDVVSLVVGIEDTEGNAVSSATHRGLAGPGVGRALI